jgi:1,4-alpha-glucan branching enzyme
MSKKTDVAVKHPGMGAIPNAKGVAFRVWVPHAEKVYVTGTFNDWSKTAASLSKEENG